MGRIGLRRAREGKRGLLSQRVAKHSPVSQTGSGTGAPLPGRDWHGTQLQRAKVPMLCRSSCTYCGRRGRLRGALARPLRGRERSEEGRWRRAGCYRVRPCGSYTEGSRPQSMYSMMCALIIVRHIMRGARRGHKARGTHSHTRLAWLLLPAFLLYVRKRVNVRSRNGTCLGARRGAYV